MKTQKTELEGVVLIKPTVFEDHRGEYFETYNKREFLLEFGPIEFVTDDISVSQKCVLRGFHRDDKTWKLIDCLLGKIYVVIVNPENKKWVSFTLSDKNRHQVLVPPKHGIAHLVLSKTAIFHYKQSEYYDPSRQFTYRYDDPQFNVWWPNITPILSQRDEKVKEGD